MRAANALGTPGPVSVIPIRNQFGLWVATVMRIVPLLVYLIALDRMLDRHCRNLWPSITANSGRSGDGLTCTAHCGPDRPPPGLNRRQVQKIIQHHRQTAWGGNHGRRAKIQAKHQ